MQKLRPLQCRWPLPPGYAVYYQKAVNTYALFKNGKRLAGTVAHVAREGGHEGCLKAPARLTGQET